MSTDIRLAIEFSDSSDVCSVSRYGGEEFAILAIAAETDGAVQAADRIRRCVCKHAFADESLPASQIDDGPKITVSVGVPHFASADHSQRQLILRADEALYASKQPGRKRVSTVVGDSDRVVLTGTLPDQLAENVGLSNAVVCEH